MHHHELLQTLTLASQRTNDAYRAAKRAGRDDLAVKLHEAAWKIAAAISAVVMSEEVAA